MTAPISTQSAALAKAAHDAAILLAIRAETAADEMGACFAGLTAIARAAGCDKIAAVAEEIGHYVAFLKALEICDADMLEVPPETLATLNEYADEISAAGREIIPLIIPPDPAPTTYALGVRDGIRRAQLLGQVQTMRRRRRVRR